MNKLLILLLSLSFSTCIFTQVKVVENKYIQSFEYQKPGEDITYSIRINKGIDNKTKEATYAPETLIFSKSPTYTEAKSFNSLAFELERYKICLDAYFEKYPNADIKYIYINFPLYFTDILDNQVKAFANSEVWKTKGKKAGYLDYSLTAKIMKAENVYAPIAALLKAKGYEIEEYQVAKLGIYGSKELKKEANYNYTGTVKIPMPYDFGLIIKKVK